MANVAIVTGGASGIGRAIASALATRGDIVTVADIDRTGAGRVAVRLGCAAVGLDVGDPDGVSDTYRAVAREHGRLDLVFNNAGIAVSGPTDELGLDDWERAIDVNLRGVIHGVRAAYPIMREQRRGHIVNMASLAGLLPMPAGLPYTTTKHAVVGLSLALRAEARWSGVKVGVVCPGFVDTPMLAHDGPRPWWMYSPDRLARVVLRGIARDRALIVAPASSRLAWRAVRLAPRGTVEALRILLARLS